MLHLWFAIGTVEICVLLLIMAAAVLAMAIRPYSNGPVETYLYACQLLPGTDDSEGTEATLRVTVLDDMSVEIRRHGFSGMVTGRGAVSIAVNVKGTDVTIEERITPGNGAIPGEVAGAVARIDSLRPAGRPFHLRYISVSISRETSLTLPLTSGVSIVRTLSH